MRSLGGKKWPIPSHEEDSEMLSEELEAEKTQIDQRSFDCTRE